MPTGNIPKSMKSPYLIGVYLIGVYLIGVS